MSFRTCRFKSCSPRWALSSVWIIVLGGSFSRTCAPVSLIGYLITINNSSVRSSYFENQSVVRSNRTSATRAKLWRNSSVGRALDCRKASTLIARFSVVFFLLYQLSSTKYSPSTPLLCIVSYLFMPTIRSTVQTSARCYRKVFYLQARLTKTRFV